MQSVHLCVHVHVSTVMIFCAQVTNIYTMCDAVHAWGVVLCFIMHDNCSTSVICLKACNVPTYVIYACLKSREINFISL